MQEIEFSTEESDQWGHDLDRPGITRSIKNRLADAIRQHKTQTKY